MNRTISEYNSTEGSGLAQVDELEKVLFSLFEQVMK
jgi:hypothetical protein